MKKNYYDTTTIFRENKTMKKHWQEVLKLKGIKQSDFIRRAIYDAIDNLIKEGK